MPESVLLIGASDKPERYAHKAMLALENAGHTVHLIHPRHETIEGKKVYESLAQFNKQGISIDTVTMYVNALISSKLEADFLRLKPKRVIFNPGAENPELSQRLSQHDIITEDACTLVLLQTQQF